MKTIRRRPEAGSTLQIVFLIVVIVSGIYFFTHRPAKLAPAPPAPAAAPVEKKNPILEKVRSATARPADEAAITGGLLPADATVWLMNDTPFPAGTIQGPATVPMGTPVRVVRAKDETVIVEFQGRRTTLPLSEVSAVP